MSEIRKVVGVRIDDRLIHGQVVTAWLGHYNANKILIVDDEYAYDEFMRTVIKAAAPPGIKTNVFGCEDSKDILLGEPQDGERIMIITRTPVEIFKLIEYGVKIDEVILGGMGAKEDRSKFYRNVSMNDREKETILSLLNHGVKVGFQLVPNERYVDISTIIKKERI